ncbi:MAG: hypothetical protein ACHQUC_09530 [Chlamydiales bacterium]
MCTSSTSTPSDASGSCSLSDDLFANKSETDLANFTALANRILNSGYCADLESLQQLQQSCQSMARKYGRMRKIQRIEYLINQQISSLSTVFATPLTSGSLLCDDLTAPVYNSSSQTTPSLQTHPVKICLKADQFLQDYAQLPFFKQRDPTTLEKRYKAFRAIERALEMPRDVWLAEQEDATYTLRFRSLSALTLVRAYTQGDLQSEKAEDKIQSLYEIALQKYGKEEGDYFGIAYYNYACWLEEQIERAENQGTPTQKLITPYSKCFMAFMRSIGGNNPTKRTPDILYQIANFHYRMVMKKDELRIKDDLISDSIKRAFNYSLQVLFSSRKLSDRILLQNLKNSHYNCNEYTNSTLILLGHLLSQEFAILDQNDNLRFSSMEEQMELSYHAYRSVLNQDSPNNESYIDALSWAIEACTKLKNRERAAYLAKLLIPHISQARPYMTLEDLKGLRIDLGEKLGIRSPEIFRILSE